MDRRRVAGLAAVVVGAAMTAVGAVGVLADDDPPDAAATTTTSTTAPASVESAEAFLGELAAALSDHDVEVLFERLHPAVLDRYGEDACRQQLQATTSPGTVRFDITSVSGPDRWTWVLDGRSTVIDDAYTVVATRSIGDASDELEVHVAPVDGRQRWFTDCGEPL